MILSFLDDDARALFEGMRVKRLVSVEVEALRGDRAGQHSILINDQWRVCFVWSDGHAHRVEIVDYH